MQLHKERAHSKFSASGSERWLKCAASVDLEEKSPPSKDSVWSLEGTHAHEVLEAVLKNDFDLWIEKTKQAPIEMVKYVWMTSDRIYWIKRQKSQSILTVEGKIYNKSIHPEMFGTCDAIIYVVHDELHIIDFKYGKGSIVAAKENTQLIQYALAAAEKYDWKFKTVTMHILQPRAGMNWHKQWTISKKELQTHWYILFKKGVARVIKGNNKPFEGSWCHWCRAKNDICPAKKEKRDNEAKNIFAENPLREEISGKEKSKKEKSPFFDYENESQENEFGQKTITEISYETWDRIDREAPRANVFRRGRRF